MIAFRKGLLPGTALYENLIRNPPKDMDDIVTKVEGEIRIEKAKEAQEARVTAVVASRQRENNHGRNDRNEKNGRRFREEIRPRNNPIGEWFTLSPTHIYRRHQHEGIFKKPPPQRESMNREDRERYCPFHEARGHSLHKCEALKPAIVELMKEGKLRQYRTSEAKGTDEAVRKPVTPDAEPIIREVLAIHGAPYTRVEEEVRLRSETRQAEKIRRVCQIEKAMTERVACSSDPVISFSKHDTIGIQFPHRDALVISVQVADSLVRRVMIDAGSSADVIFWEAFQQLKVEKKLIKPSRAPLTAFEGTETWPVGEVSLMVTTAGKKVEVDFVIINKPSAYNAILGRDWLHRMEAEASTRCQVLKFISNDGHSIVSVKGD